MINTWRNIITFPLVAPELFSMDNSWDTTTFMIWDQFKCNDCDFQFLMIHTCMLTQHYLPLGDTGIFVFEQQLKGTFLMICNKFNCKSCIFKYIILHNFNTHMQKRYLPLGDSGISELLKGNYLIIYNIFKCKNCNINTKY